MVSEPQTFQTRLLEMTKRLEEVCAPRPRRASARRVRDASAHTLAQEVASRRADGKKEFTDSESDGDGPESRDDAAGSPSPPETRRAVDGGAPAVGGGVAGGPASGTPMHAGARSGGPHGDAEGAGRDGSGGGGGGGGGDGSGGSGGGVGGADAIVSAAPAPAPRLGLDVVHAGDHALPRVYEVPSAVRPRSVYVSNAFGIGVQGLEADGRPADEVYYMGAGGRGGEGG